MNTHLSQANSFSDVCRDVLLYLNEVISGDLELLAGYVNHRKESTLIRLDL